VKGGKPSRDDRKLAGGTLRRMLSTLLLVAGGIAGAGLFAQAAFAQTNEMTVIAGFTDCTPIKSGLASCNVGNTGSSGSATSAKLALPFGVAFAVNGSVYIADGLNGAIRQVTPGGNISTFAVVNGAGSGTVVNAVTTDASGNVFFGDNQGTVYMNTIGALTSFFGQAIEALAPDNRGNLYILTTAADAGTPFFLYVYNLSSKIGAQIAATDGSTTGISFRDSFFGLALDASGTVYTIDPIYTGGTGGTGLPTILAFSMSSTGGGLPTVSSIFPALQFTSLFPVYGQSLAIDPVGAFYINEGSAVLKYVPGTNFAPIVAGTGTGGYNSGENVGGEPLPSNSNELNQVGGIFVSPSGVLYIADTGNNLVRSVSNSTGCQECGPNTLTKSDTLPVNSLGFAVDTANQYLYVPLPSGIPAANGVAQNGVVNVYDTKTDVLVASIPVGPSPGQVAIDSVNNVIYVPNRGPSGSVIVNVSGTLESVPTYTVSVIDGKTNTLNANVVTMPTTGGGVPETIAVDPTLNKAYVALAPGSEVLQVAVAAGSTVIAINGPSSTNGGVASLAATIPNIFIPSALAVDTKNNLVYVRCFCNPNNPNIPLGEEEYSMAVIDATKDTVTNIESEFQGPSTNIATDSIAVDETSGDVVIADSEYPTLHIWVPKPVQTGPPLPGYFLTYNPNFYPEHVVVDSNNELAYFTDGYGNSASLNLSTFQEFPLSHAPVVESTCGAGANVIGLDPTTDQAYMTVCPETVTDPNCLTTECAGLDLFDGPTGKLITQLPLGNPVGNFNSLSGTFAIAVNPTNHVVYVENSLANSIEVVNGPNVLGSRPALTFSPNPLPISPVGIGVTASATLTVTNSGNAATTLNPTIVLTSGLVNALIVPVTCPTPPATLAGSGTQCTYNVTFMPPAGLAETFGGSILFADTALDTPQTVNFSGTIGLTTVNFSPPQLAFGTIPDDSSAPLPITVTNEGSSKLVISKIALLQSGPTNYTNDFQEFDSCSGTTGIAPGATCTITVTYQPFFAPAGSQEMVLLQVTDNAGTGQQLIIVTGTSGLATLGYGTLAPPNVNFGNIEVNEPSVTEQIRVENTGGGPLTINSITITGSNAADFHIFPVMSTTACPTSGGQVAQFGTCTIDVFFTPTSPPITQETAQILISESTSTVSSQTISLVGTSSLPLGPPSVLPELVSTDNSVPPNPMNPGTGSIPPPSYAALSSGGQYVAFSAGAVNLPGPPQAQQFGTPLSGVYLRNTCLGAGPSCEQGTTFVAIGPNGAACGGQSNFPGSQYPAIDKTGEFVAFESNQCPGFTALNMVFLYDVVNQTSTLVSSAVALSGVAEAPFSMDPTTAEYFAFESNPITLNSTTTPSQIYLTNACTGQQPPVGCAPSTVLISQDYMNTGNPANNTAEEPSISAGGRYVAFASTATNLLNSLAVKIPTNSQGTGYEQVYLRDTCPAGASGCTGPFTTLISLASTPNSVSNPNPTNTSPSISSDGRFVVFVSTDTALLTASGAKFQAGSSEPEIYLTDTCFSNGVQVTGCNTH